MKKIILLVIAIIFTSSIFAAQDHQSLPNGCGTGWNTYLVPDSIPVLQCKMKKSCNKHDLCYAQCEKRVDGICLYRKCKVGGDLYGQDVCFTDENLITSRLEANKRKNKCDEDFYKNIIKENKNKNVCKAFAIIYSKAVKEWGDPAFSGAEFQATPLAWTQLQSDYNKAIQDFFRFGTDKQFKELINSFEKNKPIVEMEKPIIFIKDTGLRNKE